MIESISLACNLSYWQSNRAFKSFARTRANSEYTEILSSLLYSFVKELKGSIKHVTNLSGARNKEIQLNWNLKAGIQRQSAGIQTQ